MHRGSGFSDHIYLQTLVTVAHDGHTAMARGVELIFSANGNGGAMLSEGTFENTFVEQKGAWKIQSVHFYPRMIVDAAAGWAKSANPAPGPSKQFPPDRPPTVAYEIYPKFAVAPFHFDNPVTGKPPQYPAGIPAVNSVIRAVAPGMPAVGNAAKSEARVSEVERTLAAAEAYDAAEQLIDAYGYGRDDAPSAEGGNIFVNQVLQPVIDVARDGRSAKVHARLLNLGGISGGAGYWSAGSLEGSLIQEGGAWKFQTAGPATVWSAPYPGGWAGVQKSVR